MKTQISNETRALIDDSWLLSPARMAERLTKGQFKRYRYIHLLENRLAQAINRGGARLVIFLPPRHGKSWLASLFTPAWFLSLWPDRNVILSAHDSTAAMVWGRSVRNFLKQNESELLVKVAGAQASSSWKTAKGGGMVTTGIGAAIPGDGGDLLIVDDPIKHWGEASSEAFRKKQIEWFNSTLMTRANPGATVIVAMTRWHEHDLGGYLESQQGSDWEFLRLPAIAEDEGDPLGRPLGAPLCEERYGVKMLQQYRNQFGHKVWASLYQQRPVDEAGSLLKREWWRYYERAPDRFDEVVMSWDLTFKGNAMSDYVVGQVWGRLGANKFLIDQTRARMDFPATIRAVQELSARYPQAGKKLIEDRANGCALIASLREQIPGLIPVASSAGKQERVNAVSWQIESGNVVLPSPKSNPWVEGFVEECSSFPKAKHDDQVDAMAYALETLSQGRKVS